MCTTCSGILVDCFCWCNPCPWNSIAEISALPTSQHWGKPSSCCFRPNSSYRDQNGRLGLCSSVLVICEIIQQCRMSSIYVVLKCFPREFELQKNGMLHYNHHWHHKYKPDEAKIFVHNGALIWALFQFWLYWLQHIKPNTLNSY